MLEPHLFPHSARYCYVRTDPQEPLGDNHDLRNYEQLHALEKTLVSHAIDARKAEFGDGRWCAHQALQELSHAHNQAESPILRGERGMPLWPQGFVGSITHTTGFRAAVVAPRDRVRSIGLDAEPSQPLPDGVLHAIASPTELVQLGQLRAAGVLFADRLLFCAKEATYKAWFPMTQRFLDFDEAEIDLRIDGTLTARINARPTPVTAIRGKWLVREGYVVVSAVVPELGHTA